MTVRVVASASYRRMPWKNGGGETIELAVHPKGADLAGFDWRVSMALVAVDGPFSAFPGVDRTIAVVDGAGMVLHVAGEPPRLLRPGTAPLAFAGDAPSAARLTDGPVQDLNVMTRRGCFTHSMQRIDLTDPLHLLAPKGRTFVVCGQGRIRENRSGGHFDAHDALACESGDRLELEPTARPATAFLIHIASVPPSTAG